MACRRLSTGLFNRRHFEADLDKAWSQAAFSQQPVAMLLMDVDYFKRFNDTQGHPAGDTCLQAVSKALRAVADVEQGTAGRLGGEEFGLLLPGRTREAALQVGERLCEAVRQLAIAHNASEVATHVTVSVGSAVCWPGSGDKRTALFQWVDDALYAAKHAGRDRAHAAPEAAMDPVPASPTFEQATASPDPVVIRLPESNQPTLLELDRLRSRGFKWLHFPDRVEAGYQSDRAIERRKHLAITAVIGLILVNLYTVMSRDMFPDVLDNVVNFQLLVGGILICMVTV